MRARALWVLPTWFCALLCIHCSQEKLAGGYDDVENPAIQVSLVDTLGHPSGAAEMRVYARYQNPAKDSIPLLQQSVAAGSETLIRDTTLMQAMTGAAARGIPWPNKDTVEFNLFARSEKGEAFLGDFLLVKAKNGTAHFLRRAGTGQLQADAKGVLAAAPVMAPPVLAQRASIGDRGLQLGLQAAFIPGSPYAAKIAADGSFSFARMAAGKYDVKAVSSDAKVYSAADSLSTGTEYFPSDWSEADILWIE